MQPETIRLPYKIWFRHNRGDGPCPVTGIIMLTDSEQDDVNDYLDDSFELRLAV